MMDLVPGDLAGAWTIIAPCLCEHGIRRQGMPGDPTVDPQRLTLNPRNTEPRQSLIS
jgi:hypothetical protein